MFYALTSPSTRSARSYQPASSQRMLEKFLSETLTSIAGTSTAAKVEDLEKTYAVQLDVPGLAREQIDVHIEADVVRVTSKADAPRQVKAAWRFPLEIDAEASSAKLENGVLTLTLGKKLPVNDVKTIEVH